jgi:L-fucono-1,5-lactonase
MERIDAHHHFWFYDPKEYPWIDDRMGILKRNFLPEDFEPEVQKAGVTSVVPVQAKQSWRETWQLLQFANDRPFIAGVVGWVPLLDSDLERKLPTLLEHPKLKGVRHAIQDEPDPLFILLDDFNRGIRELEPYGIAFDLLIFERHLPQTIRFVDWHPEQVFVLDHIAKPNIAGKALSPWRENLQELARRPNVYCKLSGMVTEADWVSWTKDDLQPFFDVVLEAFGSERLMFGSDWPVCLLASSYARWADVVAELLAELSPSEQARIWAGTARRVYKLGAAVEPLR